jgi:urease accessory protein UreF
MHFHEQIAFQIAKERIEDAVRTAQRMRAIRSTRAPRSARVRLGSALVRLGNWMMSHA